MRKTDDYSKSPATSATTRSPDEEARRLRVAVCVALLTAYALRPDVTAIVTREARQLLGASTAFATALAHTTDEVDKLVRRALARQLRSLFWVSECRIARDVSRLDGFDGAEVDVCSDRARELLGAVLAAAMGESFHHYVCHIERGGWGDYPTQSPERGAWVIESATGVSP